MNKKLFVEPKIYPLKFSCHAIKVGDTVYTPGVVSVDTQGNLWGKEISKLKPHKFLRT